MRCIAWLGALLAVNAFARGAWAQPPMEAASAVQTVPMAFVPSLDVEAIRMDDVAREAEGLPPRYAIPVETILRPASDGVWTEEDNGIARWRLRVQSPGAVSINLGFTGYYMPPGGKLALYATDGSYALEEYTAANNSSQGELWTAVVLSDDIIVEVALPQAVQDQLILDLTSINVGYRGFVPNVDKAAGACEIDVKCPLGNNWWNEIPAIGVISTGGSLFCSGFMVNNTRQDQTPYFMTANHCGITSGNAGSLVVYWNYQKPGCSSGSGSLSQSSTGSTFRASYSTSDFTLVQLNAAPNPTYKVTFAGWDRSGVNATEIIGIHHPDTDVKKISYSPTDTKITSYLSDSVPGNSSHFWVEWLPVATNQGATEGGSSGSPLFDQNHRVIGQLHGGYSACGSSDMRDWYGRIYMSWTGGGTSSTRLSNWLDPNNTGQTSVDTLNPYGGMSVTPVGGLDSTGDPGGPFAPSSIVYTLSNPTTTALNYTVTNLQTWISLTNPSGTIPASGSVNVTVSINSNANSLAIGTYTDTITFTNTTNHGGDTTRSAILRVGGPKLVYSWPLDTDPGWVRQGLWAFGQPTGSGSHNYDPASGHTGLKVYGYNLSGDYLNDMLTAQYLTTTAIDCSNVRNTELRFWRWLGCEAAPYDHADVAVSNNGTTWTTLWSNPSAASSISDAAWAQQVFDIAAVADGQATVYIRWGMGPTDSSTTYPGWNIDDVEILGDPGCGDLNGDFRVDAQDYAVFRGTFGRCEGDPLYRAAADLDDDGCITLVDYQSWLTCYRTSTSGGTPARKAPSPGAESRTMARPANQAAVRQ